MEEDESPLPEEGDADAQIGEIGMLLAAGMCFLQRKSLLFI